MRTFRTSVLAGAGAVALAAGVVMPGIALADEAPGATDSITVEGSHSNATATATASDQCTVEFTVTTDPETDEDTNWVLQYRVDGADPKIPSDDGAFYGVFMPVVATHQDDAEALNEKYADEYGWDVGVGEQTVTLDASADGTHEVEFWFYRGIPTGGWDSDNAQQTGTVTVTGCEDGQESDEDAAGPLGSLGSLDVFGSLGSLLGTED